MPLATVASFATQAQIADPNSFLQLVFRIAALLARRFTALYLLQYLEEVQNPASSVYSDYNSDYNGSPADAVVVQVQTLPQVLSVRHYCVPLKLSRLNRMS